MIGPQYPKLVLYGLASLLLCACAPQKSQRPDDLGNMTSDRGWSGASVTPLKFQFMDMERRELDGTSPLNLREPLRGGDELAFYVGLTAPGYMTIWGLPDFSQGRPIGPFHVLYPPARSTPQRFGPADSTRIPAETSWVRLPAGTRGLGFAVTEKPLTLNTSTSPADAERLLMRLATEHSEKVTMIIPGLRR
jgi:hypothetical protein